MFMLCRSSALTAVCGIAGVRFPQLTLLLRYLAFTHCLLRAQAEPNGKAGQALGSPEDRETEELLGQLLGKDRDPPPLPPNQASYPSQARDPALHWRDC